MNSSRVTIITSPNTPKKRSSTTLGILTILLGLLCISAPLFIGITIQFMVGTALVMGGIFQILLSFQSPQMRLFSFLTGALTLACGGYLFSQPLFGISIITFLLITYFIATGALKIIAALKLRPFSGWGWQLISGAISLLLGIALSKGWPVSGAWAIGVFLGVNLIITGIIMLLGPTFTAPPNTPSSNDSSVIDV